jgi:hypothetical protein
MGQITETVKALEALISQHRRQLEGNPDFRAIQTLERSVRELKNGATHIHAAVEGAGAAPVKLSQPAAARQVILTKGEPVSSAELVEGMSALGVHIGGKNKQRNLTSVLSSHKGFKSVNWKGGYAWWVTDRDVPKSNALI